MKKITTAAVIFAVFIAFSGNCFAQGEAAAEFLLIAPGARAGGMGEANVAIANDATTTYWNPAGLGFLEGKQFTIMHSNWLPQFNLDDLYYDFAAYTHEMEDVGTFGLSVTYLSLGEQVHTGKTGEELGRFTSFNMAVAASYGSKIRENLSMGVTLRYIHLKLADVQVGEEKGKGIGKSVGVDVGVLYKPKWFGSRMTLGANLSNLGPKVAFVDPDQADPLPTNLKLGVSYKLINMEHNKLTATIDFNKLLVVKHKSEEEGEPGKIDPFYKAIFTAWTDKNMGGLKRISTSAGMEYWYSNLFALRAGYFYEDIGKRRFFTFGAGLRFSIYGFDFGYIAADREGSPLADTMRFSLLFSF